MMSATQTSPAIDQSVILGGASVQPAILAGQTDPRSIHYAYSAGERVLKVRAADVGFASIEPGYLVPLRVFRIHIPNDTIESLYDKEAPQQIEHEVTPRDSADALMSRYQHRGVRILMPLVGMSVQAAAKIYAIIHPPQTCKRHAKELPRQCVECRIADLEGPALDRIEKAKLGQEPTITYGRGDDGEPRYISEEEAAIYCHELILSASQELKAHMIDTLSQSKADVEAGKNGPGKKKFDKRDDWYFLNTHTTPDQLAALEAARVSGEAMATQVERIVSAAVKTSSKGADIDVEALLEAQERQHKQDMATLKKELMAAMKKDKTPPSA